MKWTTAKITVAVIAAVGLLIAIPIAYWAFTVATSGVKGRGDQIKDVNGATNRTQQYNHFYDLNAQYESDKGRAALYKGQLDRFNAANPAGKPDPTGQIAFDRQQDETNLTGTESACVDAANTYNNDSAKVVTGAQFKAWDLPATLDPTDCEVN